MTLTVGSLFSGIGGLDLGLERAGMTVRWQSEIDPYACRVLAKHWPDVPNLGDVTRIDWSTVERVDVVVGGFPCQDLSHAHTAGQRQGLGGARSGLWTEFARCVGAVGPRVVVVENSGQAWRAWVPTVRADLAALGYATLPVVLHAGTFGAPHIRPRCFVVGDADSEGQSACTVDAEAFRLQGAAIRSGHWSDLADAVRVDDGVSHRVDRLRALGNAVVPQVAEFIGRRLMEVAT